MTWDCPHCGTRAIAIDLTICPNCGKEREMPKTTAAGPSNAWEETPDEGRAGAGTQAEAPQTEAAPETEAETPEEDGYDDMSLAELQDLSKERGLPVSGTKAQLAQALRESDAAAGAGA